MTAHIYTLCRLPLPLSAHFWEALMLGKQYGTAAESQTGQALTGTMAQRAAA